MKSNVLLTVGAPETLTAEAKARIIESLKEHPAIKAAIEEGQEIVFEDGRNTETGEAVVRAQMVEPPPPTSAAEVPEWRRRQIAWRQRMDQLRVGRTIAGADVNDKLKRQDRDPAYQHRALKDSGYVTHQGEPFVRRAVAKVKGKAAKKAAKKLRHKLRAQIGNAGNP